MDTKIHFGVCLFILLGYMLAVQSLRCNEAVCGPIVSKCMLTQSCKCDAKNVTCSKDCFICLDEYYARCCSCVEMCPQMNETEYIAMRSHVEDLPDSFPDLFNVLMEEKDELMRWISYTYPIQISFVSLDKEIKFVAAKVSENDASTLLPQEPLNCTVAFMSQCMPWNKCKDSCGSIGAASYRWFHDGCCECVGQTCLNYGMNESRCLDCPPGKEEMTEEEHNLISKETAKAEEVILEDNDKKAHDAKKEDIFDDMQNMDS